MEEITILNADYNDLDQTAAALQWYGNLDDVQRYVAVDSLDDIQGTATFKMVSDAILYCSAFPAQQDFDLEVLHHLAMLISLRNDVEGWF